MPEIYVNDWGTKFQVTLVDQNDAVIDISAATTSELRFRKPDGALETKPATQPGGGTDGVLEYETVNGDLDTAGRWTIQAHVVLPTGDWSSSIGEFHVRENV